MSTGQITQAFRQYKHAAQASEFSGVSHSVVHSVNHPVTHLLTHSGTRTATHSATHSVTHLLALRACILLLICFEGTFAVQSSCAQNPFGAGISNAANAPDKSHAVRALSAVELAIIAAESNLPEVSFEAVRRAVGKGPVIANVNLGGLLGGNNPRVSSINSNQPNEFAVFQAKLASKLVDLNRVWLDKKFDSEQCYSIWLSLVFPSDRPNEAFLFGANNPLERVSSSSFVLEGNQFLITAPCGGQLLVDWAARVEKLDELRALVGERAKSPGCADTAAALALWIALMPGSSDQELEAALKNLTTRANSIFSGLDSEQVIHSVILALERLGLDSAVSKELSIAVLGILKTGAQRERGPQASQFLKRLIQRAIEANDAALVIDANEAVLSQWNSLRPNNAEYVASIEWAAFRGYANYAFEKGKSDIAFHWLKKSMEYVEGAERYGRGQTFLTDITQEITRNLLAESPQKRYEYLKDVAWSLPMLGLRSQAAVARQSTAPSLFLKSDSWPIDQLCSRDAVCISLLEWTMRDAIASGQSADVEQRIGQLATAGSEDAKLAEAVWQLANNKPIQLDPWVGKNEAGKPILKRMVPSEVLPIFLEVSLATAAIREPATHKIGIEFLEQLESKVVESNSSQMLAPIRSRIVEARQLADNAPRTQDSLRHWSATGGVHNRILDRNRTSSVWSEQSEGRWGHLTSRATSHLFLNYPLTGDFEIQFSLKEGQFMGGGASLAGSMFRLPGGSTYASFGTMNGRYLSSKTFEGVRANEFNTVAMIRKANNLECKVNDNTFVSAAIDQQETPFFSMIGYSPNWTTFEKVRIVGSPEIPREILLSTPMLLGWSSEFLNSTLRGQNIYTSEAGNTNLAATSSTLKADGDLPFDWHCVEGIIESVDHELLKANAKKKSEKKADTPTTLVIGPSTGLATKPRIESAIAYTRPLCEGESIELEFYQDSQGQPELESPSKGRYSLAPSLSQTVLLLDQPVIALHWIALPGEDALFGIDASNRTVDPGAQQLSPVTLKEKEWNSLRFRIQDGVVAMAINGQETYRRQWEMAGQPQFGLFHNPQEYQVRVRNVRLSGNWPPSLPNNLMETK